MIKAIVVDMDGTLLDDKNSISEKTVSVIKKFQENGGFFAVNTGRSYLSTVPILEKAGIKCDCLCLSGAAIYSEDGRCILNDTMKESEIQAVRELEKKYGLFVNYITTDGVYTEASYEMAKAHYIREIHTLAKMKNREVDVDEELKRYQWLLNMVHFESDIESVLENGTLVYKMTVMSMDDEILKTAKETFKEYPSLTAAYTFPTNFEVNASRVDKGLATIEYICYKGLFPEEVMVIGDSENDIPMFKMSFAKKIAMGNATDEIKKMSTDITTSNLEDGVAYAIQKWGLKE